MRPLHILTIDDDALIGKVISVFVGQLGHTSVHINNGMDALERYRASLDDEVKAARAAFEKGSWANMAPAQRKRIMLKLADLMMKNREELALLESECSGRGRAAARARLPGVDRERDAAAGGHLQEIQVHRADVWRGYRRSA